jgi:hypothetical protein
MRKPSKLILQLNGIMRKKRKKIIFIDFFRVFRYIGLAGILAFFDYLKGSIDSIIIGFHSFSRVCGCKGHQWKPSDQSCLSLGSIDSDS